MNALGRHGTLERGHCAPFEPLAQLGDALGGVGAVAATIESTERIPGQTATEEAGKWGEGGARMQLLLGSGALQSGDLRLREDGTKCRGSRGSNVVRTETANDDGQTKVIKKTSVSKWELTKASECYGVHELSYGQIALQSSCQYAYLFVS